MTLEELIAGKFLKTAEDQEGAGRLTALAFAHEMERLGRAFGLDKMAAEPPAADVNLDTVDIDAILSELGG